VVESRRLRNTSTILAATIVFAALLVVYLFPPGQHAFYPRCIFHVATGLLCPGCGSLRATHQLLHGNLQGAILLNPLFLFLMVWLAGLGILRFAEKRFGKTLFPTFQRPIWIWALVALIVLFGVLRNFPFFPGTG
jgi:hypothetical protein